MQHGRGAAPAPGVANGGTHSHLRRRIRAHGIDTSHFRLTPVLRGRRARTPAEVLVLRDPMRRRAHPDVLRRALAKQGVPLACAFCGTGGTWNGKPLTLHVDHINGRFLDYRPENLRLLCPNCHSQTDTYAGRNRARLALRAPTTPRRPASQPMADASASVADEEPADTQESVTELLHRIERGELATTEVARRIGRHRNHVHRLRRQLRERTHPDTAARRQRTRAGCNPVRAAEPGPGASADRGGVAGRNRRAAAESRNRLEHPSGSRAEHGHGATL